MPQSPLSIKRFRFFFALCWLIVIVDHAFVLHWHSYGFSWLNAFIDSGVSNGLLLLASLLIMTILRYYLPKGQQYVNIFVICVLLTVLWIVLSRWLLRQIAASLQIDYGVQLEHSIPIRFSIGILLLGCFTLVSILWYRYLEQKKIDTLKADAEKLAKEAELFKLRQQLQPHFLFNSLNSINALIGSNPQEARKMVQQLSEFLRGTIKKGETQWVSLQEEMQYLQLYLDIEKVRFGNRLTTKIEVADDLADLKIPALLLQPIVENAIKFGLYDTIGETLITVQAHKLGSSLVVEVTNPFDPTTSMPYTGTGFGLSSIKRRLYLYFAQTDLLKTSQANNFYTTTLTIPQTYYEKNSNN